MEYFANDALAGPAAHAEALDEAQAVWTGQAAEGRVDPWNFSARITGTFTPTESGRYRVGIAAAGLARVFVDGALVADAWTEWRRGRTFFEQGCDEVVGTVRLDAGQAADIVIEFATRGRNSLGIAGFRMGLALPLGDDAIAEAVAAAGAADAALVFVGRSGEWDTEGSDLETIALPGRQDALVRAVADANPRTIVVLQTGGPVEMPWIDAVGGVLQAWYPGQEAGNAIADVLLGRADPGGRLPQTFPARRRDHPADGTDPAAYPGQGGKVAYREGVFVGYRHYQQHGIAPLFPFGFGLSYTDFAVRGLELDTARFAAEGAVTVRVEVGNTGSRPGAAVIQLYVGPAEAPVARPKNELKAFAKVRLEPGEATTIALPLDARAFAYFDVGRGKWVVAAGAYAIRIGSDAQTVLLEGQVTRASPLELDP